MPRAKKRRGRKPKLVMPPKLDGVTPEQVADVVLRAKPKQVWRYEQEYIQKHGVAPRK